MARRRPSAEQIAAIKSAREKPSPARALAAMCRPKRKRPAARSGPKATTIRTQVDRVREIVAEQRWSEMDPAMLVALYAWMHSEVYGVDPSAELAGKAGLAARGMARRMLEEQFGGDREAAVDFMRWAWTREKRTEEWRRENGRVDGRRLGWRWQFGAGFVNEYRIALRRQRADHRRAELSTRVESA